LGSNRRKFQFLVILLLLTTLLSGIASGSNRSYPKPSGNLTNDFAGMLSQDDLIEKRLLQLNEAGGIEFAVVTVPHLNGESIEGYAEGLFQAWSIGKKGKDTGLLLLIAKEERLVRIEVGYGLEPYIPDAFAGHLIDSVLSPRFGQGQFDLGVLECIDAVAERLGVELESLPSSRRDEFSFIDILIIIAVLLLFFSFNNTNNRRNRRITRRPGPMMPPRGGPPRGGGGGFGGFGGGRSGGGGASGKW
jgi:uncharacterized protein